MILEGALGDRISCTMRSETFFGVVAQAYPASTQNVRKFQLQITGGIT